MQKRNHDNIRCGLLGLGRFGRQYLRVLQNTQEVTLCAVANRSGTAFQINKDFLSGIHTTTNNEEIFSNPDIDAVCIVTPPSTHYALIEAGLKAGKHVFVEKPMVLTLAEAERLKTLVAQSGGIFMVGFQYLFNDSIRYLKNEIEKGAFGKMLSVTSEHAVSRERPDVDIFWDAGAHPLSVFQYVFNPANLISVEGELEPAKASVRIQFDKDPMLEIIASSLGERKIRKTTIVGEKAVAVLDETLEDNKLAVTVRGKTFYPEIIAGEPLQNELEHFIHCIQTGSTPLTDINFGYQITTWLATISRRVGHI